MKWDRRSANSLSLLSLFYYKFTAVHAHRIAEDSQFWNLIDKPNLNDTTSNFIFETANSLLQRWPNTRYRNGEFLKTLGGFLLLITQEDTPWLLLLF